MCVCVCVCTICVRGTVRNNTGRERRGWGGVEAVWLHVNLCPMDVHAHCSVIALDVFHTGVTSRRMMVKVVHGNRSDDHCKRSDTR